MMASLLYLFLGALFGFTLFRATKAPLHIEEAVVWGIPVGIMLLTFWTFVWAVILRYQDPAIVVSSATAAGFIFYHFNFDHHRHNLTQEWRLFRKRMNWQEVGTWLIVLVPWLLYTLTTVPHLLFFKDGALVAGWINVWGDWAVHLRNSTFFASTNRLSLENPLFANTTFHYPYLSDYLSAILQRLNLPVDQSLTWPTAALFATLPGVLYIMGRRITSNRLAGVFFSYIVMLAGGMGVYFLVKDLMSGHYFWQASAYAPKLYTDVRSATGSYSNDGIWFMNFIMSEFIPQRAFLAGISIALYVLYIGWQHLTWLINPVSLRRLSAEVAGETKVRLKLNLLFAGVLFGTLPLFHTHSFIALGVIIPTVAAACLWLNWMQHKRFSVELLSAAFWLLLPATLLGFALLFVFVFDFNTTGHFIHSIHWWIPNQDQPANPLVYWLRNAGPIIILGVISTLTIGRKYWPLVLGGLVLFLACNFFSFQPWHYDNLKIMTYWYIAWALPVALLLAKIPRRFFILTACCLILLCGAGLADTLMVHYSTLTGIQLSSKEDVAFAETVKDRTEDNPNGLFIIANNHDNPISLLTGRRLYVGYAGWLWTYGINSGPREDEVREMYSLSEAGLNLLHQKHIAYITLGPQEIDRYHPNLEKMHSLFPTVVNLGTYQLLKVK